MFTELEGGGSILLGDYKFCKIIGVKIIRFCLHDETECFWSLSLRRRDMYLKEKGNVRGAERNHGSDEE